VKLFPTVTPVSDAPSEMPAISRSSVNPVRTVPVSPLVTVELLKMDAVPSRPLFGEPVAMPLYSKICRPRWAVALLVTVTA
jgi:hypothetical protein